MAGRAYDLEKEASKKAREKKTVLYAARWVHNILLSCQTELYKKGLKVEELEIEELSPIVKRVLEMLQVSSSYFSQLQENGIRIEKFWEAVRSLNSSLALPHSMRSEKKIMEELAGVVQKLNEDIETVKKYADMEESYHASPLLAYTNRVREELSQHLTLLGIVENTQKTIRKRKKAMDSLRNKVGIIVWNYMVTPQSIQEYSSSVHMLQLRLQQLIDKGWKQRWGIYARLISDVSLEEKQVADEAKTVRAKLDDLRNDKDLTKQVLLIRDQMLADERPPH